MRSPAPGASRTVSTGPLTFTFFPPTFADTISIEAPYFDAFDVQANGYLHRITVYQNQINSFAETLDQIFYVLEGRLRTESEF